MFLDWIEFGKPLTVWMVVYRLLIAAFISAPVGLDRGAKNRAAGLRTHILVCVGAAVVALCEQQTLAYVASLGLSNINVSVGRITSTVVSGVGFLGAGTIMLTGRHITGLTTAASLWCCACIGLVAGAGFTTIAIIAGVLVFLILRVLQKVVHVTPYKKMEVQFFHRTETLEYLNKTFADMNVTVVDVDFHAETTESGSLYTNVYTLAFSSRTAYADVVNRLSEHRNIRAVRSMDV